MDNIDFWNTRSLNRPIKQEEMNLFLHNNRIGLFGLLKTKVKRGKSQGASLNLCKECVFGTNMSQHHKGRI